MARPKKKGLDYFPLDADIFEDDKLFDLQNEYGPLGEVIYLRLLCLVYKHGYYYKFDSKEKLAAMIMRSVGNRWTKDKKTVIDVIDYLAKINLFSSELMQRSVLTSRGIQARYLLATERRQSNIEEYSLLEENPPNAGSIAVPSEPVSVAETPITAPETPVNVSSKYTKESKVNESKEKESIPEKTASPEGSAPVASPELDKLIYDYGKDRVTDYVLRVKAWHISKGKAVSDLEGTVRKWLEQDGVEKADHTMDKYLCVMNKFDI